jgi:phosphoglycerol transferase MdoB-like AlkP superfamily enzyme
MSSSESPWSFGDADAANRDWRATPAWRYGRAVASVLIPLTLSLAVVFAVEAIFRGSAADAVEFLTGRYRPGWTTVAIYMLAAMALDAIFGRAHQGWAVIAPTMLLLAWFGYQKSLYLGDPLYPSDLLFARQMFDLLPLLVSERPLAVAAGLLALPVLVALVGLAWRRRHRLFRRLGGTARILRLAVALPALVFVGFNLEAGTYSWYRDRMQIAPKMWDQTANYDHNGFSAAFMLNIPMAKVAAPAGYSRSAMEAMDAPGAVSVPAEKPDIVMVMSESFWDPTLLPGVDFDADPIAATRRLMSGQVFSPEFGGMTANVEFEALTGFSNAFLPFGAIPYQQYIRRPVPSLASFLGEQGYVTRALHPFRAGFWNREAVYESLGFQDFRSSEDMRRLKKRGGQVSDLAFADEIIRQAEAVEQPLFFFAVTIQGHGPYPAKRYPDATVKVDTVGKESARGSIRTYAEGLRDADRMLSRLVDWAKKRERPTIIVYFGDHLPPLGSVYKETGFLEDNVAPRTGPAAEMLKNRQTPLVLWSNQGGQVAEVGTVSPMFLPLHVLDMAGMSHPHYTGFLRRVHDRFRVIDRHLLIDRRRGGIADWQRREPDDPLLSDFRRLQYDLMFGERYAAPAMFPES